MKRAMSLWVVLVLLAGLIAVPAAYAGDTSAPPRVPPMTRQTPDTSQMPPFTDSANPPGELLLVDALILRPIGLIACFVGLAGTVATLPTAITSNSTDRTVKELADRPFQYTFTRPLGDVD